MEQTGFCRNQQAVATAADAKTGVIHVRLTADGTEADVTDKDFTAFGDYSQEWLNFLAQSWGLKAAAR